MSQSGEGDINELIKLIDAKANIDIKDRFGSTALILASRLGYFELVAKLIDAKANIDIQNNFGYTALIMASLYGYFKCTTKLIGAKANIDIKNKDNKTAIDMAKTQEIKDMLIDYKKSQIIEELVEVLPFPTAVVHIYNWIADYAK